MDLITYSLWKKIAAGAATGISDLTAHNQDLFITTKDGQTLQMHFPAPTEFSIEDCYIRESDYHLIMTFSDDEVIDCGAVPFVNGYTPAIDAATKEWVIGSTNTGVRATLTWEAI